MGTLILLFLWIVLVGALIFGYATLSVTGILNELPPEDLED